MLSRAPRRSSRVLLTLTVVGLLATGLVAPPASAASLSVVPGCSVVVDPGVRAALNDPATPARVVLGAADLARVRDIEATAGAGTSSDSGMRVRQQLRLADASLTDPLPSSPTSLQARASFDRILRLQVAMVLAEDGRSPALAAPGTTRPAADYARRVRQEVAAFLAMPSWGSTAPLKTGEDALLATAEVGAAVALGYSVAGGTMTATERSTARAALRSRLLGPACWGWANGMWMTDATHNWGAVVGSSTAMAALVVADSHPDAASAALTQSLRRVNAAIRVGTADGGTAEGPGYAGLIHDYVAYLNASMEASLGRYGTSLVAPVPGAARYVNAVTGPSGQLFSYADSNTGRLVPVLPVWNSRHGGDPLGDWLGARLLAENHPDPLLFVWARPPGRGPAGFEPPALVLHRSGVATLRSGWTADDTFVGVKAGSNAANHAHLDLGSVVVDMAGHRFVGDPGRDNYSLPGYFKAPTRQSYWRISSAGHSTLTRAGARQQPLVATAPMSDVLKGSGTRAVAVNMTQATGLRWAQRRVTLSGRSVYVQDSGRAAGPEQVRAALQTQARVAVSGDGRHATMSIDGAVVDVSLSRATPGRLRAAAAPPAPPGGISTAGWTTLYLDAPTARSADGWHRVVTTMILTPR